MYKIATVSQPKRFITYSYDHRDILYQVESDRLAKEPTISISRMALDRFDRGQHVRINREGFEQIVAIGVNLGWVTFLN